MCDCIDWRQKQIMKKINVLRTDNGRNCIGSFKDYHKTHEILPKKTPSKNP